MILSTVHNSGVKKAMEYTYGATIAFGILLFVSATLNMALVTVLPAVLPVMQIIGGIYIAYLAVQIFRMKSSMHVENRSQTSSFISGFLMQFINPKVVLFTMTVIPSFVLPYYTSSLTLILFVLSITIVGFLAFITWILFGSIFKDFLQKHQKAANRIMALFLLYSAIMVSGLL
ncbi:LysE family transporter [Acetobacterium wieringae]|nr:LysE family transporter [Acetobacterium wieringae]